jgi:peptide/nickel transport system permease protein
VTLSLTLGGAVLWLILGVGIGVMAARRPRSLLDRSATVFVLGGLSMPTFLVGLLLLYVLFFRLHLAGIDWFPGGGYVPFAQSPAQWAQHLILPWLTLALVSAATYSRLTRGSLLEVLGEDYVRTARSKGLSERRVVTSSSTCCTPSSIRGSVVADPCHRLFACLVSGTCEYLWQVGRGSWGGVWCRSWWPGGTR